MPVRTARTHERRDEAVSRSRGTPRGRKVLLLLLLLRYLAEWLCTATEDTCTDLKHRLNTRAPLIAPSAPFPPHFFDYSSTSLQLSTTALHDQADQHEDVRLLPATRTRTTRIRRRGYPPRATPLPRHPPPWASTSRYSTPTAHVGSRVRSDIARRGSCAAAPAWRSGRVPLGRTARGRGCGGRGAETVRELTCFAGGTEREWRSERRRGWAGKAGTGASGDTAAAERQP